VPSVDPVRWAILSDIHGNLDALRASLEGVVKRDVAGWVCLGDVVGYGAYPNECVAEVMAASRATVAGNHDYAVIGREDISFFNPWARAAALWTMKTLTEEHGRFLSELGFVAHLEDARLVHSTPLNPDRWEYIFAPEAAGSYWNDFEERVCFVGHSHAAFIAAKDGRSTTGETHEPFRLPSEGRTLVNAGSVGQPRDGDSRACFAIFDTEEDTVELVRVPYNVPSAQRAILNAGLPEILAARLAVGQ
jgi:predicted phosphodiesterase